MIFVNGQKLPSPTKLDIFYQKNRGSQQLNALGETVRDVMPPKREIHIRYTQISHEQGQTLFSVFAQDRELALTLPFPQGDETLRCYADTVQTGLFRRAEDGRNTWGPVFIRLTEV